MYRQLYDCTSATINGISYVIGQALITGTDEDQINPTFIVIENIFMLDDRNYVFICKRLHVSYFNNHYQAYQGHLTNEIGAVHHNNLQSLPSPWPLLSRKVTKFSETSIALRQK